MKYKLFTLAVAVLMTGLLGSCSDTDERIDNLEKRVDGIENNQIASVEQQITAISVSINDLKAADATINDKIAELKAAADAQQTLIDALKEADKALGQKDDALEARIVTLEGQVTTINGQIKTLEDADKAINLRIDELKTYVDTEIGKTKDWAKETFATLEQYQQTADDLATLSVAVTGISTTLTGVQTSISGLDTKIDGIDAALQGKIADAKSELEGKISTLKTELEGKIASAISASETSIKAWINELLEGYYTAAQVDAKVTELNTSISNIKDADKARIDSLTTELTTLKTAVDAVKTDIRTEYRNAIDEAINKLDGEIRGALLDSIAAVNGRIDALDTRVSTLELRMQAIEGRVDKLEAAIGAYTELQGTITEIIKKLLADVGDKPQSEQDATIWECITALQAQCGSFGTAIEALQGLVGSNVATQISEAIAALVSTQKLEGLADAVSALKDIVYGTGDVKSLTQQIAEINTALSTTYVTKTQLGQDIAAAKADLQCQIDSLCNVIGKDGTSETATGLYKKIAELNAKVAALEAVNITIGSTNYTKWSDAVQAVLDKVAALGIGDIDGLQSALSAIEARLDKLEAMIQSVSITPAYSDGSVEAVGGILAIKFIVRPAEALSGITSLKDSLLLYADFVKVRTRAEASAYMEIPVTAATVLDAAQGAITLRANIANYLPTETDKSLVVALNVKNGISDYTTEFYPVTLSSNVTVKDETDTTKVTIKADADFPEFTMGTIPVASGFTDSKPTTITVEGIGNITFDKEATAKIKSNAQSEGATNVFFKVEDVTTTKPVTNADVVLEVTMKTVDENGIEVFSKGKAAGEVTIEIPMDEDVAYVNSVTLVDDAGEPIQGGVVPGSEKIENGKLIFKVNHFSKYAIDYVTTAEYKAVTGVSIEPVSVTLQVGDTLRLVANIVPEDATNKEVSWRSDNTGVVTVDATGKVTAVKAGTAAIIVTTKDGSKTASCTVTVSAPQVTVTFDLYGITGTAPTSQTIEKGGKVTKPADPTYANHTFAGWYKTKDATTGALSDQWDFGNDIVTADMTLYANWTRTMMDLLGNDFPKSTGQTVSAPGNAWTNNNGYKAYIYNSDKFFKLDPGNGNGLALLTSNQFTRISDRKYVFNYVNGSTNYGVFTLNIEDSKLVSIEYDGAGTTYDAYSGTYKAPTPTTTGTAKATIGGSQVDVNWIQLWKDGPKFAEYNVGVTDGKAESYGGYYAWGGNQDKVDDHNTSNTGTGDLTGTDDTATALWGENWRMPKQTELQGLIDNCTVVWTTVGGKNGRKFTGKGAYASNSVFLPAAGYCNFGDVFGQGGRGGYWSSTPDGSLSACSLGFRSGYQLVSIYDRYYGFSVRAVLAE